MTTSAYSTLNEPEAATPGVENERWSRRRWVRVGVRSAVVLAGLALVYFVMTFVQVWHASRQDDARAAQAIIVLGAAQYDGRPSAVLQARLDHAHDLYDEGLAPLIVVTGGRQEGDRFTEAEASANYLMERGVPGGAIERETTSNDTYGELAASARFLRERGISRVVLVSDPFHAYRINAIADEVGLEAYVSPTGSSPVSGVAEARALFREAVAVSIGRLIGYGESERVDERIRG